MQYPIPGLTDAPFSPGMIAALVGVLFSVAVELVPQFAAWWSAQDNSDKVAIRGWLGLLVTAALVVVRVTGWLPDMVGVSALTPALVVEAVATWFAFVLSGEVTYQANKAALPRKA